MSAIQNIIEKLNSTKDSDYKLDQKIGLKENSVVRWRKGQSPNIDACIKIADYFQISLDELVGRTAPAPAAAVPDDMKEVCGMWQEMDDLQHMAVETFMHSMLAADITKQQPVKPQRRPQI